MNPKITLEHLKRRALVYIRQSSPGQMIYNLGELSAGVSDSTWAKLLISVCRPTEPGGQTDACPPETRSSHHLGASPAEV